MKKLIKKIRKKLRSGKALPQVGALSEHLRKDIGLEDGRPKSARRKR